MKHPRRLPATAYPARTPAARPRAASVLIVDDDDAFRKMVQALLEQAGYTVHEAGSGSEAMRILDEQPVSLVILDIVLPQKEGLKAIQELSHTKPHVKILAISGGARIDPYNYSNLAAGLGAAATLAKPFTGVELLTTVSDLCRSAGRPASAP